MNKFKCTLKADRAGMKKGTVIEVTTSLMHVRLSLVRNLVMLPIQAIGTSRRYNIRKCNYKKNAGISKNISIFLKFSPKITILYKVSPKQSNYDNYDRERKEETGNVRTAIC